MLHELGAYKPIDFLLSLYTKWCLLVTSHINLPDKRCLSHCMCLYHVMMTLQFLNDVANDANEHKYQNYVIIANLNSETMGN